MISAANWPVLAQTEPSQPQEQQLNPLELKVPDPLLPNPPENGRLVGAQAEALAVALEKLNIEAAALLKAGNIIQAFSTWNRELRLRRFLGPVEEVRALTRVAKIAREQNQRAQVQVISGRLQMIYLEAKASGPVAPELLQALASAFLLVQTRLPALDAHQQILANARAKQDKTAIETNLQIIADLHFAGFEYSEAAAVYEELLVLSEAKKSRTVQDDLNESKYLEQLAFLYEETNEIKKALDIRGKILNRYRQAQNPSNVAALKIAMGRDWEKLGRLKLAAQYYQEAYTLAWALQQFGRAGEALQQLAVLYQSQNLIDASLQVYQALIVVQQRGYDFFGMMNTFDKIGKIHVERKAYSQAIAAFQKGLELARQLKYNEDYFNRQISDASQDKLR